MNKYLEKVAGMIPRNLVRAAKQGIGETLKDAKAVGGRMERAKDARTLARESYTKYRAAEGNHLFSSTLGQVVKGTRGKMDKAYANLEHDNLRLKRATKAADLARKGGVQALSALGAGAAGTAAVTGTAAAVSKKKGD
jgi:hypothetical protein